MAVQGGRREKEDAHVRLDSASFHFQLAGTWFLPVEPLSNKE